MKRKKKNNPKRLPRSIAKYIRREKARLKQENFDNEEYKKKVEELYIRFHGS